MNKKEARIHALSEASIRDRKEIIVCFSERQTAAVREDAPCLLLLPVLHVDGRC